MPDRERICSGLELRRAPGSARRAADSPAREARLDLYQGHLTNEVV